MKLKSLLMTTTGVVLMGTASLTNCLGSNPVTEYTLSEINRKTIFVQTTHANQKQHYHSAPHLKQDGNFFRQSTDDFSIRSS